MRLGWSSGLAITLLAALCMAPSAFAQDGEPHETGVFSDDHALLLTGEMLVADGLDREREAPSLIAQAGAPPEMLGRPGAESDDWRFNFALLLWASSLEGNLTVRGETAAVDASFGDIVENLDFAFQGHFEATKKKWTGFLELFYAKLSDDLRGSGPLGVRVDVETEQLFLEFGGTYRLATLPVGQAGALGFELLAGGRYFYLGNAIDLARRRASGDIDWIDPIVGGRIGFFPTDRLSLWVRGDVGGFDISSSQSDFAWNFIGGLEYRFWGPVSAVLAYRILDVDYEEGSGADRSGIDLQFSGPILALGFHW